MTTATPTQMLNGSPDLLQSCDDRAWTGLIRYLLDQIAEWLGYEVITEALERANVGNGFCLDILHAAPSAKALVHWKGILGASIVDDQLRVSLLVFLYSGSERLVTKNGHEFAEYVYVAESNGGRWELYGWFRDEYGEYEQFGTGSK